jgi:hypothetical protein
MENKENYVLLIDIYDAKAGQGIYPFMKGIKIKNNSKPFIDFA